MAAARGPPLSLAEWVEALTEILRIIAWPAIVAWLVWYLRDEVKRAAARIIELGLTGAKFAPPSPPEQVASPPGRALQLPGSHPATPQEGSSRVQQYVASIRAFISDDQLDFAAQRVRADVNQVGSNPTDQVEALIYTVALLNIQIAHERNYNAIYGSQLRLLAQMTSAVGASPAVARQVFEEAKAAYPDAYRSDTFERWTGFLLASGLCTITQDGNYVLTPFGRGFLKYIVDRRLPTDKPF
jgi:hypothetical protein